MGSDEGAVGAVGIAGVDLVALRGGEVEGDARAVGAEAESVGEAFADAGEFFDVGAVLGDVEDLAAGVGDDLDKEAVVV